MHEMKRIRLIHICLLFSSLLIGSIIWSAANAYASGLVQEPVQIAVKVEESDWSWLKWLLGIVAACVPIVLGLILNRWYDITQDGDGYVRFSRRATRRSRNGGMK